jgi:hypothetical protein
MRLAVKTAFAACGLALSFTSPTWAQSPPPGAQAGGVLPPYEVLTSVRSMGLDPVGRPALRGRVYVLRAFDDTQFEKRVVVDARSGAVLSVRDAISSSPAYTPYDPRYGRYEPPRPPASIARAEPPPDMEPLLDEPLFPRSARVAPAAGREVRSAAVNPRTPLPKMRPAAAATTQDAAAPPLTSSPAAAAVASAPAATPSPTPLPSADALAAASSSPGKSIPAPVATHAYVGSRTDAPEKPPAEKSVTQLVPVAPLE